MKHGRYTSLAAIFAATGAFVLALQAGCGTEFHAYRARVEEDGTLKTLDPAPVKLPLFGKSDIPVYWKDHGRRQFFRPSPDKQYVVIGRVEGLVGYAWQTDAQIEEGFRRAAVALGGDAVMDARRGPWMSAKAANQYYARIVKWKPSGETPAQ